MKKICILLNNADNHISGVSTVWRCVLPDRCDGLCDVHVGSGDYWRHAILPIQKARHEAPLPRASSCILFRNHRVFWYNCVECMQMHSHTIRACQCHARWLRRCPSYSPGSSSSGRCSSARSPSTSSRRRLPSASASFSPAFRPTGSASAGRTSRAPWCSNGVCNKDSFLSNSAPQVYCTLSIGSLPIVAYRASCLIF